MDILTLAQINKLKTSGGVGYAEKKMTVVLETTMDYNISDDFILDFVPIAGKQYTVVINGKQYVSVATAIELQGVHIIYLGSGEVFGVGGSEPWTIGYIQEMAATSFRLYEELDDGDWYEGPVTLSVSTEAETIHPIDPKFIPGAVLPVVDIKTLPGDTGTGNELTAEESAQLDALNGAPFIMFFDYNGFYTFRLVMSSMFNGFDNNGKGSLTYLMKTSIGELKLVKWDGVWRFYMQQE